MPLQRIDAKLTTSSNEAGEIPTIEVEGETVREYNEADAILKKADATKKRLAVDIIDFGVREIYRRNVKTPKQPIGTVRLVDGNGNLLRVQFTASFRAGVTAEEADALFENLVLPNGKAADANDYVQEVVVGKFDDKVFLDAEGLFDQKKYDKYRIAIEAVARQLGDVCPLEVAKCVKPLSTFMDQRWVDFPKIETQELLTKSLPNTVSIVPMPPIAVEAAPAAKAKGKK